MINTNSMNLYNWFFNLKNNSKDKNCIMDPFLIIVAIVTCGIFLLVDLYIMAIYSHKQQTNLSIKNILCKILIIISLLQIEMQPLFLIVDVINSRTSSTDLTIFWIILYFSILVNIAFIKPLFTSLYQSDQDDPCWKTTLWIIAQVFISMAVFGVFVGMGWLFWGYLTFQIPQIQNTYANYSETIANQIVLQTESTYSMQIRITVPCLLLGVFCLIGYPILVCCGGCGLTALPLSLIMEFNSRPTYRRTSQAKKIVEYLKQQTVSLVKEADALKRSLTRIQYVDGWWNRRKKNSQLQQQLKQIENKFMFHRDYYDLFRMELKMEDVNPIVFIGKLLLGILCIVASIMLWVQILLAQLIYPSDKQNGSVFLDAFLIFLQNQNANFISVAFLMLICIFMAVSMIKGAFFISNNFPFITIHPIIQGKTWLNSFLFQLSLCILGGCSLVHLLLNSFPYYLRSGQIILMMGQVLEGMTFISIFIKSKAFVYCYLIIGVIGGVYVMIKMTCLADGKTQLLKMIEQKRKKLFGKDNEDKPLHMIQMTEMNLKQKQKQVKAIKSKDKSSKDKNNKTPKKKVKLTNL